VGKRREVNASESDSQERRNDYQAGDQIDAGAGMCCILHSCFFLLPTSSWIRNASWPKGECGGSNGFSWESLPERRLHFCL
jgi:hypothetical protein